MRRCLEVLAGLTGVAAIAVMSAEVPQAQTVRAEDLVASLKKGGYVLVMRHASSPGQTPDKQSAHPDNVKMERQLDEAGRAGAARMGKALRDLKVPIGEVLSSPTYRALETARLAQLPNPASHPELGDLGRSMQGVSEAEAAWLRDRASRFPKGTNTIIVSHSPNIARAFPEWGAVAEGEVVVVGPDGTGRPAALGRIRIDQWSTLK